MVAIKNSKKTSATKKPKTTKAAPTENKNTVIEELRVRILELEKESSHHWNLYGREVEKFKILFRIGNRFFGHKIIYLGQKVPESFIHPAGDA